MKFITARLSTFIHLFDYIQHTETQKYIKFGVINDMQEVCKCAQKSKDSQRLARKTLALKRLLGVERHCSEMLQCWSVLHFKMFHSRSVYSTICQTIQIVIGSIFLFVRFHRECIVSPEGQSIHHAVSSCSKYFHERS